MIIKRQVDFFKFWLFRESFSFHVYVSTIIQFLCAIAFLVAISILNYEEAAKFQCENVPVYMKRHNEDILSFCYERYQVDYETSILSLYIFGTFSNFTPVCVAFAYSYYVQPKCLKKPRNPQPPTEDEANNQEQDQEFSIDVSCSYYIHLVIRFLLGILFIVLLYTDLSSGFDSTYKCSLSTTNNGSQTVNTTIQCENSIASQQNLYLKIVSVLNAVFSSLIILEMLHLCPKMPIFKHTIRTSLLENRYKKWVLNFLAYVIIVLTIIFLVIPGILHISISK